MHLPPEVISAAAFAFEAANGNALNDSERAEVVRFGLEKMAPDLIALQLQEMLREPGRCGSVMRSSIYWALGKKHDPALKPFFREALARELQRDPDSAYQIMIALDNPADPVFAPERSGVAVFERDLNERDARTWLQKQTGASTH